MNNNLKLDNLIQKIRSCKVCSDLPCGPRPILSVSPTSKILIIGQAPWIRVHTSGIPWDDPSGERLRQWLWVDTKTFYDASRVGIMPLGLCYPWTGKTWDLPPRKECAPLWHEKILEQLPELEVIVLIGWYAQKHYLWKRLEKNLTETVKNYKNYLPKFFVLPHPSPRNNIWMKKNQWFEAEVIPELKKSVSQYL